MPKDQGHGNVEIVGTLQIAYLDGHSGETQYYGVRMRDFEALRSTVGAYLVVRRLRQMLVDQRITPEAREIFGDAGMSINISAGSHTPMTRRPFALIQYRVREGRTGIVPMKTVSLPAFNFRTVNLINTEEVRLRNL